MKNEKMNGENKNENHQPGETLAAIRTLRK